VRVRFAADAMTVTTFEGAVRLTWDRVRDVRHARGLTAVAARSGGMMIYALPVELDAQQRAAVDGWRVEAARRGPQPAGHEQAEAPQPEEAPGHDPAPDRVVVGAVLEPRHTALLVMARRPPRTWRRTGVLIAAAGVLGLIGLLAIIVSLAPAHPGTVRSTSETVIALVSGLVLVVVSVPWIAAIARQAAGRPPGELGARFAHRAIWGSDPAVTWTFDVDGVDLTTTREQRSLPWSAAPEVAVGRGVLRVGSGRTSVAVPLEFLSTDQISRIRGLSRGSGRSS